MHADLTPLSGRTSFHSFELIASTKKQSTAQLDSAKQVSSRLINARLNTQDFATGVFLERKTRLKSQASLSGHRFSREDEAKSVHVARLTAKAAQADFKSFRKFLEEEKRLDDLKQYWAKLKVNFHEIYLELVRKNEEQKSLAMKQGITRGSPQFKTSA